jgi:hypothetical protein
MSTQPSSESFGERLEFRLKNVGLRRAVPHEREELSNASREITKASEFSKEQVSTCFIDYLRSTDHSCYSEPC